MHKICVLAVAFLSASVAFAQKAVPYFTEPAVAPNRAEIAFVSGGDIWTAPLAGGEAHLLVSHPATESRPMYSPDGTRLAFVSNRTGNGDLYVLNLNTGALQRITFDDADGGTRRGFRTGEERGLRRDLALPQ
jgi:tricorn protease